jgi:hypothetical protein
LLTTDLLRVRRRGDAIAPRYLRGADATRARALAERFLGIFSEHLGASREELDAALSQVEVPAKDRLVALGLRKLLEDRSEFQVVSALDPETVRREVFLASAAAHRALELRAEFDRAAVLAEVASRLSTTAAELDKALYADLRGSEILARFDPIAAAALLVRYDVALAQGILLRATRVAAHVRKQSAARYRVLFRAMRFHGLLHVVRGAPDTGYVIELDGPFSLFDAVQRYGLKLALFLPHLLACDSFELRAQVLWGKTKDPLVFDLSSADGLQVTAPDLPSTSPDLEGFVAAFDKLGSEWSVEHNERIFALPGEVACVPDLVFCHRDSKELVYLEAFGFWSRDAVWKRVELLRKGFPARVLLAVGKQLRVSEEVLDEDASGEIYVYRSTISPRAVLERLHRPRAAAQVGREP